MFAPVSPLTTYRLGLTFFGSGAGGCVIEMAPASLSLSFCRDKLSPVVLQCVWTQPLHLFQEVLYQGGKAVVTLSSPSTHTHTSQDTWLRTNWCKHDRVSTLKAKLLSARAKHWSYWLPRSTLSLCSCKGFSPGCSNGNWASVTPTGQALLQTGHGSISQVFRDCDKRIFRTCILILRVWWNTWTGEEKGLYV